MVEHVYVKVYVIVMILHDGLAWDRIERGFVSCFKPACCKVIIVETELGTICI